MTGDLILPPSVPDELVSARLDRYALDHGIPLDVLDRQPADRMLRSLALTGGLPSGE